MLGFGPISSAPISSIAGTTFTLIINSTIPIEIQGWVTSNGSIQFEFLSNKLIQTSVPIEALINRSSTSSVPVEFLAGRKVQSNVLIEFQSHILSQSNMPIELLSGRNIQTSIPIEALIKRSSTSNIPIEFLSNKTIQTSIPIEFLSTVTQISSDSLIPIEFMGWIENQTSVPIEFLSGKLSTTNIPIEFLSGKSSTTNIPIELLSTKIMQANIPIESLSGVSLQAKFPIEFLANRTIMNAVPVEFLKKFIGSTTNIPIEFAGNIHQTSVMPIEFSGWTTSKMFLPVETIGTIFSRTNTLIEFLQAHAPLPPSGTYNFDLTVFDIIRQAYLRNNFQQSTIGAMDYDSCLEQINIIYSGWIATYDIQSTMFNIDIAIAKGQKQIVLPLGTVDVIDPITIKRTSPQGTLDLMMKRISSDMFEQIVSKDQIGLPNVYWVDRSVMQVRVNFWCASDIDTDILSIWYKKQPQDATAGNNTTGLSIRWLRPLIDELAVFVAMMKGRNPKIIQQLIIEAQKSLMIAVQADQDISPLIVSW